MNMTNCKSKNQKECKIILINFSYLDLLTQGLLVVESLDIVLLECIKGGAKIEVDIGELIASLSQMIKYLEKDKEYY